MGTLVPLISNSTYRPLYSATVDSFPQAFLLLTAFVYVIITIINFYLWYNRSRNLTHEEMQMNKIESFYKGKMTFLTENNEETKVDDPDPLMPKNTANEKDKMAIRRTVFHNQINKV